MTDEEMAVNWIRSQGWSEENLPTDEFGQMFQAYLAGLKAGRPKWHKVADGDLPKYDVLGDDVSITVLNQNGNKVFYNFLEKAWKLESNNKISKVIAWCEIPKYTEE